MAREIGIRIGTQTYDMLRELAGQTGESVQAILDKAIEEYRRQRFFDEMRRTYAALRADPDGLAAGLQERAEWDAVLLDGLEAG